MAKYDFTPALKAEYESLFAAADLRSAHLGEVDQAVTRILGSVDRYQTVERQTGVPWFVVAVIHIREASGRFDRHLHNGDPLSDRTYHVPAGRPPGDPPFTWEESAIDALHYDGLDRWRDWSIGGICYALERFNGFGYRMHGVNSPYLWGYTTAYSQGLYVADGQWSGTAVNKNPGAIALMKRLAERGAVILPGTTASEDAQPAATSLASPPQILRRGDHNDQVAELQRRLIAKGYNVGKAGADGWLGKDTETALWAFIWAALSS